MYLLLKETVRLLYLTTDAIFSLLTIHLQISICSVCFKIIWIWNSQSFGAAKNDLINFFNEKHIKLYRADIINLPGRRRWKLSKKLHLTFDFYILINFLTNLIWTFLMWITIPQSCFLFNILLCNIYIKKAHKQHIILIKTKK